MKKITILLIFIIGLIIGGGIVFLQQNKSEGLLTPQAAAEKAIAFIEQTIQEDVAVSLLDVSEESGVYKIHIKIGENEYDSYVTKNGKFLFASAFNLEEQKQQSEKVPEEESSSSGEPSSLDDFAKCLADKGAKFYGASWCGWCKKQKELFGEAAQYLPYVECVDEKTNELNTICKEAGIGSFPTWEFNGEKNPGFKTFEQLAELSGCQL